MIQFVSYKQFERHETYYAELTKFFLDISFQKVKERACDYHIKIENKNCHSFENRRYHINSNMNATIQTDLDLSLQMNMSKIQVM